MSKEVAKKVEGATGLPAVNTDGAWGSENLTNQDILIPRLLLAQPTSRAAREGGSIKPGALYKSATLEEVADKTKRVNFIPLSVTKSWRVMKEEKKIFNFDHREPMTPQNQDAELEWTAKVDGKDVKFRRDRELVFYVLLEPEVKRELDALAKAKKGEMPSADDALLPCVLAFTRSSYQAGKVLATHFARAGHFNLPPASSVFSVGVELETNDLGTYYVLNVGGKSERRTTQEELQVAKQWYDMLGTAAVKIDDVEDEAPVVGKAPTELDQAVNNTF